MKKALVRMYGEFGLKSFFHSYFKTISEKTKKVPMELIPPALFYWILYYIFITISLVSASSSNGM